MKYLKSKNLIFVFLLSAFLFPLTTKATVISGPTQSSDGDIGIIKFKSNCTAYTTKLPKGGGNKDVTDVQVEQSIYYNKAGSGTRNLIWFQHGDGQSTPRDHCLDRFDAKAGLNTATGKNYMVFCPEMNPSSGVSEGDYQAVWSLKYNDFFPCLFNDFVSVAKDSNLEVSSNLTIASFSQGGPATNKIIPNTGVSEIKIQRILHFDSCYGNYCADEANLSESQRGPMYVYVSDKASGSFDNSAANKAATVEKKIYEQSNVQVNIVTDKVHADVPKLCGWDFLSPNQCNKQATLAGGSTTDTDGTGNPITSVTGPKSSIGLLNEIELILQKPKLQITIPGLSKFSEIVQKEEGGSTYIYIPFLGEYMAAIYRYAVIISSIFAVVMIINNGLKWVISGGTPEKVNEAKTRIGQSLVGLLLVVGSYTLLYTINPELVKFNNLRVKTVEGRALSDALLNSSDDLPAGSMVPIVKTPIDLNELNQYKNQGCGKNLYQIAKFFSGQIICQSSCNCANFVSHLLTQTGCAKNIISGSADDLVTNLKNNGWKLVEGTNGAQPGDVAVYNKSGKDVTHVEVVSQANKTIGSNVDMRACWIDSNGKNIANQVEGKCGSFWDFGYSGGEKKGKIYDYSTYGYSNINPSSEETKLKVRQLYSLCVANFNVCPPLSNLYPEKCGYCEKLFPVYDKEISSACSSRQCVQEKKTDFTHYLVNPNR
ncbi:pilin [Patescibacteria group bacterium]|nr:pilin [Patescibacteria group bacterium]